MEYGLKVNDFVSIDWNNRGRIASIIQPLVTYKLYNVKLVSGEMRQVPRYRCLKIAETPSTPMPQPTSIPQVDLPSEVLTDLMNDDLFTEPYSYDHSNIDAYVDDNRNVNTVKKTKCDMKRLGSYMESKGDLRPIETIVKTELCDVLCSFVIDVTKTDGTNYEPSSLKSMVSSFDRHLKSKNYSASLFTDTAFSRLTDVIKTKQKVLKSDGKGNLPKRSEALSDDDVENFWQTGQLGTDNPESILNSLWWFNTTMFGIRSVKPQNDMKWGDVSLKTDRDGTEYIQFQERQSKTCQGDSKDGVRNVCPKAWATGDLRCPVSLFKRYSDLRPAGYSLPDSPFYLATNTKQASVTHPWFKRQPVGVNKLGSIMKRMAKNAGLDNQRFTYHSARKYLVQKLADVNVPPTEIMQISGHRNVQSINNFSSLSMNRHKEMSRILSHQSTSRPLALSESRQNESSLPSTTVVNLATQSNQTTSFRSTELVQSIFSAPIYGGTINVNFFGPESKKMRLDDQ